MELSCMADRRVAVPLAVCRALLWTLSLCVGGGCVCVCQLRKGRARSTTCTEQRRGIR